MGTQQERSILIIGNGPSARELLERGFGSLPPWLDTFGMGAAYRYFHSIGWWPTYYALADTKVVYSHRGELANLIIDPAVTTRRFFFPLPLVDSPKLEVIPHSSTGDFCFLEAIRRGYKTIYLIGVEGDYIEEIPECRKVSDEHLQRLGLHKLRLGANSRNNLRLIARTPVAHANYFFDWYQSKGDVYSLPLAAVHRQKWENAARRAHEAGVEVVNLSRLSTLKTFRKGSLASLAPKARPAALNGAFRDRDPRNVALFFPTLRTAPEKAFWRAFVGRLRGRGYNPVVVLRRTAETLEAESVLGEEAEILHLPKSLLGMSVHPDFQAFASDGERLEPRFPPAFENHFVDAEFLPTLLADKDVCHGVHRQHRAGVAAYNNWLVTFLKELRIGKIVVNNDTFMKSAAVRMLADRARIPVIHSERSPVTTHWFEPNGFYGRSDAAALLADGAWRRSGAHERVGRALVAALRADPGGHRSLEGGAKPEVQPMPGEGRRRFLLPMDAVTNTGWMPRGHHLAGDNYPLFASPLDAITALHAIAEAHDAQLIVKPHPSDRAIRALKLPAGVALYDGPVKSALEQADLVFCFLTKVAFAALAFDRPVVTLSPNVAALSGLTYRCDRPEDLPACVEEALADPLASARQKLFARFLGYLDRRLFVSGDLRNPGAKRLLDTHFPAIEPATPRMEDFRERLTAFDSTLPDTPDGDDGSLVFGPFSRERGRRIEEVEIVWKLFESGAIRTSEAPVMLDVGACKGAAFKNFAAQGWTVHAFEPNPPMHAQIQADLDRHPPRGEVILNQLAVSERSGEELPFYTSEESIGISSLSPFRESHKATAIVKTVRLDEYCAAAGIRRIDFLKVDTEGFDLFVLRSFNWRRSKPRVIVCEFENAKTERLGYTVDDVITFLRARGYQVFVSEWHPITRYGGGEHRWRQMLRTPTGRLGPDAWGNLVAFRDPLPESTFAEHTRQVVELLTLSFFEATRRLELREERDRRRAAADEAQIDDFLGIGDDASPTGPEAVDQASAPEAARRPSRSRRAVQVVGAALAFLARHPWLPAVWLAAAAALSVATLRWPAWNLAWATGWAALASAGPIILVTAYAQRLHLRAIAAQESLKAANQYLQGTVDDLRRRMDEVEAKVTPPLPPASAPAARSSRRRTTQLAE